MIKRGRGRRLAFVLLLLGAALAVMWPLVPVDGDQAETVYQPYITYDINAIYGLSANGTLGAAEAHLGVLQDPVPEIGRVWDLAPPGNPNVRIIPQITGVSLDGFPAPYRAGYLQDRRYFALSVGDEDNPIPAGPHNLFISYSIEGATSPAPGGGSVTPVEMISPLSANFANKIQVNFQTFATVTKAACEAVTPSQPSPATTCETAGVGAQDVSLIATNIEPGSGFAAAVYSDAAPPAQNVVPWTADFDGILGQSLLRVYLALAATVIALATGIAWSFAARETPPGAPVGFSPPLGLGPAQVVYSAHESLGQHVVAATLVHLTNLGLIQTQTTEGLPVLVTRTAADEQWRQADASSRYLAEQLGLRAPGDSLSLIGRRELQDRFGSAVSDTLEYTRQWHRAAGFSQISIGRFLGALVWWIALAGAVAFSLGIFAPTIVALPFAAFVIGGFGLTAAGVTEIRTESGRELWAKAAGFERFLSTPSSEKRFEYAAQNSLRPEHLAYALAFGVLRNWQDVFRTRETELAGDLLAAIKMDDAVQLAAQQTDASPGTTHVSG